jgi:hypothetical protein
MMILPIMCKTRSGSTNRKLELAAASRAKRVSVAMAGAIPPMINMWINPAQIASS